ncbi:hypothetical protein BKA69DRAFT_1120918 [Paraphysoderma sedebokerense]|nr:hypothetical protein BKA69DRAFT_1120918 [Paraphysoderma sedebokerense]
MPPKTRSRPVAEDVYTESAPPAKRQRTAPKKATTKKTVKAKKTKDSASSPGTPPSVTVETSEASTEARNSPAPASSHDFELIIERLYKTAANRLIKAVSDIYPSFSAEKAIVNLSKPRSKSFEVTLRVNGNETLIWTGVKKGPPRKLKFPDTDEFLSLLAGHLKQE